MTEKPVKPRVEVVEESHERLEVLELKRTTREQKLAKEQAMLEGATEVHYAERAFRPHHESGIEEIRKRVDKLAPRERRALPEVPAPPTLPPEPPARPRIAEHHEKILGKLAPGKLVRVETAYETEAGELVDATWSKDGKETTRAFLLKDGKATPVEDVERRVDAMPAPTAPLAPAPAPEAAAPEAKADKKGKPAKAEKKEKTAKPEKADGEKKGLFGLGAKKADAPAPASEESASDEASSKPKKRFGFGRK